MVWLKILRSPYEHITNPFNQLQNYFAVQWQKLKKSEKCGRNEFLLFYPLNPASICLVSDLLSLLSFIVQSCPELGQLLVQQGAQPGLHAFTVVRCRREPLLLEVGVKLKQLPVSLLRPLPSSLHMLPQRCHTLLQMNESDRLIHSWQCFLWNQNLDSFFFNMWNKYNKTVFKGSWCNNSNRNYLQPSVFLIKTFRGYETLSEWSCWETAIWRCQRV